MYTIKSIVIILRSFGNTMYPFKSSATTSLFPVDNCTGKFNLFGRNSMQCCLPRLIWAFLVVWAEVYILDKTVQLSLRIRLMQSSLFFSC